MVKQNINTVVVQAYPRIHVGLIDLNGCTNRKYGGAGFSINGFPVVVEAIKAKQTYIEGIDKLDERGQSDVRAAITRLSEAMPSVHSRILLKQLPIQHIGLGSKTAIILAVLKSIQVTNNFQMSKKNLQLISGRGGASGIGINTFFSGGFIIDGGQEYSDGNFMPSAAQTPHDIPPIICRVDIPNRWNFHLILPQGRGLSGQNEFNFFKKNTPIPAKEVYETLALMYHGVAPAVINDDLSRLKNVLAQIQRIGFKRREVENHSRSLGSILQLLDQLPNCAVGLSSMGPLIYVIANKKNEGILKSIEQICNEKKAVLLGHFSGRNRGFKVTI